ncbi:hypothetical protein B0H19DRAFT_1253491 [Mycena capillaripes]|nr:hypothetical protein B0H19DRAFT_1253491 [Mycena capillaripes]
MPSFSHPLPAHHRQINPSPNCTKDFLRTAGSFLFCMGMFLPINFLILNAQAQGMSPRLAAYLIPIFNVLSLFGRVLPGYVGDRLVLPHGRHRTGTVDPGRVARRTRRRLRLRLRRLRFHGARPHHPDQRRAQRCHVCGYCSI